MLEGEKRFMYVQYAGAAISRCVPVIFSCLQFASPTRAPPADDDHAVYCSFLETILVYLWGRYVLH